MYKNPEWGPGRVDPFNPVKFGILKLPVDTTDRQLGHGADLEHESAPGDVAPLGRA